jgi:hypothetical protein
VFGLVSLPAFAQTPAPAPADPIRELLVEVRALRAALERAATVGARIQLLVARVQIQEQRLSDLTRRADNIRSELSSIDQQLDAATLQQKMFSERGADIPPEEREAMAEMIKQFAVNGERLEKRKQELMLEENMVAQQIGLDQGRWSEINNQLDQLERTLTVPAKQ